MGVAAIRKRCFECETLTLRHLFADSLKHEPSGSHRDLFRGPRRQLGGDDVCVQERWAVRFRHKKLASERRLAGAVWSREDQDLLAHTVFESSRARCGTEDG